MQLLLLYITILPKNTKYYLDVLTSKNQKKKNMPDKLQSFSFLKFSFYSNRIFCQFYQAHYFFGLAQTFSSTAFIYCCNKEKIIRHEAQQKLRISYAYLYHSIITSQITKKWNHVVFSKISKETKKTYTFCTLKSLPVFLTYYPILMSIGFWGFNLAWKFLKII